IVSRLGEQGTVPTKVGVPAVAPEEGFGGTGHGCSPPERGDFAGKHPPGRRPAGSGILRPLARSLDGSKWSVFARSGLGRLTGKLTEPKDGETRCRRKSFGSLSLLQSGREDLNLRPHGPEASGHTPPKSLKAYVSIYFTATRGDLQVV